MGLLRIAIFGQRLVSFQQRRLFLKADDNHVSSELKGTLLWELKFSYRDQRDKRC